MDEQKRRKVWIDGVEFDVPADMTDEEAVQRHRELQEGIERARQVTETLDLAQSRQAILQDMENADPPWPPEALAFFRSAAAADEVAALHRAAGEPLTERGRLELLQKMMRRQDDSAEDDSGSSDSG
ncbi:MAG: hypothetical protein QOH16_3510 [Gaiellaceae bacterium]|nr:hypothetical protein [Gaiellaceae bacterium]